MSGGSSGRRRFPAAHGKWAWSPSRSPAGTDSTRRWRRCPPTYGYTCFPRGRTGARQICRNCATATGLGSRRVSSARTPRRHGTSPSWPATDPATEDGRSRAPTEAGAPGRAGAAGDRRRNRAGGALPTARPPRPGVQPGAAVRDGTHARGAAAVLRARLAYRGDRHTVHVPGAVAGERVRRAHAYGALSEPPLRDHALVP